MDSKMGKAPLCKFINDCRDWKEKGQCRFRHDVCSFKDKCQSGDQCKFYHPQKASKSIMRAPQGPARSGVKNTPCKFGPKCVKKATGTCPFNHDMAPLESTSVPKPRSSIPQQCRFGDQCNKFRNGTCPFKHTNAQPGIQQKASIKREMSLQQNNGNNYSNEPEVEINVDYNAEFQKYEDQKLCKAYAMGECGSGSQCNLSHYFTLDNSLKRTFFKTFQQGTKVFCSTLKVNSSRVFAVARGNTIGFYELDTTLLVFKSVCASELKVESQIQSLFILADQANPESTLLVFTSEHNKIHKVSPLRGIIDSDEYLYPQNLTGATFFMDEKLLFLTNSQTGFFVEKNGEKEANFTTKMNSANGGLFSKVKVMKQFKLLGQSFMVIGTEQGHLGIVNKVLDAKDIQIPNSTIIDLHACLVNQKPILFVVTCENNRKYSVLAMSLLDFSMQTFISLQNSKISKIHINLNRILVGIDGVGVLVYSCQDLPRVKGRIPLLGKLISLECDGDGNLIVLEQNAQSQSPSLSIYILRK